MWAFQQGLPTPMIHTLGDWASDTYLHHLDVDLELRLIALQEFMQDL